MLENKQLKTSKLNSMKNFLFGVLATLSLGLLSFKSVQEFVTIKPATPKYTTVVSCDYNDINSNVIKYVNKGYVVHSITNGGGYTANTIIMVKY